MIIFPDFSLLYEQHSWKKNNIEEARKRFPINSPFTFALHFLYISVETALFFSLLVHQNYLFCTAYLTSPSSFMRLMKDYNSL